LASLGLAELGLFDPDPAASDALAQRIEEHYPGLEVVVGSKDPAGYDVVVNASPIGMKDDDPLPVDVARITPGSYVGDVVLNTDVTPFLQAAMEAGCTVQVGRDMLFELVPAYLSFFGFDGATADQLRSVARRP
jgi:shikimate dehydrogenase